MAELSLEDDWEWLLGDSNAKPVEVSAEMLDYEFVARSTSIDELRAVMIALRKGDFGRYPDLEKEAKAKLIELLPAKEKRKAVALSKPSVADVNTEREGLEDWLACMNADNLSKYGGAPKACSTAPVRAVTTANVGGSVDTVPIEDIAPAPSAAPNKEDAKIFRKEKLSTKEYFHRWDKYDVDAAVAALESDDEEELEMDREPKEQPNVKKGDHTKEVNESLAGLTLAERTHMSIREREKGNEAFKAGENEEALCCYDRSILLDESNAKAFSNRAAVFVRQSNFDRAVEDCTKALTIEPNFLKALARRGMSYHKAERYEESAADFAACHELKSDAGYDRLMQKSTEAHERSKSYHSMVIHEVDDDSSCLGEEEDAYDYIEEVYTPGARSDEEQRSQDGKRSVKCEASSSFSANLKAHFSKEPAAATTAAAPEPSTQVVSESSDGTTAWHKVSIVDSDEESVQELATSLSSVAAAASTPAPEPSRQAASESSNGTTAWHKISIVETTDSDEDSTQEPSNDSNKLKEDGIDAMKNQRFDDAVALYTKALEVDPSNIAALNNRTVARIKMEAWKESIADATSCLDIEPTNTKALYRRGYSKMMQSQKESSLQEALDDFQLALSFDPPNDQRTVLTKKVAECNRILSSLKASCEATGKKKVRSHDSRALAF